MILIYFLTIYQLFLLMDAHQSTNSSLFDIDNRKKDEVVIGNRIIGGEAAHIDTYPFAASISIQWRYTSRHHCGGTYIMPRFVLTAAHCLVRSRGHYWITESPWVFTAIAGTATLWYSPTWQISHVDLVIPHPYFNYYNMAHDIGVVRIITPFRITRYVSYAPLPLEFNIDFLESNDVMCTVIGWGKTTETSLVSSAILRKVEIPLIPTRVCNMYFDHSLHDGQICAGRKEGGIDACQGDSGGPLICKGIQIGLVSWGHGCAAPNSPGVYCRVDFYLNWINKTIIKNISSRIILHYEQLIPLLVITWII